jgi:hypothetical protein
MYRIRKFVVVVLRELPLSLYLPHAVGYCSSSAKPHRAKHILGKNKNKDRRPKEIPLKSHGEGSLDI